MDQIIQKLAKTIFDALEDRKATNIKGLNLDGVPSYTDFIFVCSASNDRQVKALADWVQESVNKKHKLTPLGVEGYESSQWILIDYGYVICHVFLEETREFYHIEDMWPQVEPFDEKELRDIFG